MHVTVDPCVFIKKLWTDEDDGITNEQYTEVVLVLNVLKKWEWIKEIEPYGGFSGTSNEIFDLIVNSIDTSNHSGFTLTIMFMRVKMIANSIIKDIVHECTICSLENDNKFILLDCSHRFHRQCIINRKNSLCPLCRKKTIPNYLIFTPEEHFKFAFPSGSL